MTNTPPDQLVLTRRHVVIPLLVMQIYPVYMVWTAFRQVPPFTEIFADLLAGASLPPVTQFMFMTYRWWIILPLITTGLVFACHHLKVRTMTLPSAALVLTLLFSHGMRVILTEGCLAPMIMTISQLGM